MTDGTSPSPVRDVFDRVRQPEYTGENRCLPCTALNGVLALVLAAGLGVVVHPWLAVPTLVVAGGAIYLRGYLVPKTPELTRRYLPERVLGLFGKDVPTLPEIMPEAVVAAGLVDREGDGLRLTEEARTAIARAAQATGDPDESEVAEMLGLDETEVTATPGACAFATGERLYQWESPEALLADCASARVLADEDPEWATRSPDERDDALVALRTLLEECPACGGTVEQDTEQVETCCRDPEDVTLATCEGCDARLVERQEATKGTMGDDGGRTARGTAG